MSKVPSVVVLDHGSGNVRSVVRALEAAGAHVDLTADRARALEADGLVVPGVGAYAATIAQVRAWVINRYYYQSRIPMKDAAFMSRVEDPRLRRAWRS